MKAEMIAIYITLLTVPLNSYIHIFTDLINCIDTYNNYQNTPTLNVRCKLKKEILSYMGFYFSPYSHLLLYFYKIKVHLNNLFLRMILI